MFRAFVISLFLITGLSVNSKACDCFGPLHFCETVFERDPDLVILGVKKADQAHGMRIEILEILKGTESRQEIKVWGDNGILCRHFASEWSVGDTVIFALDLLGHFGLPLEDSTDYVISICGTYFLHYSEGKVSGAINGSDTLMTYTAFKNMLPSCVATTIGTAGNPLTEVRLFPNPVLSQLKIVLPVSLSQEMEISFFNLDGKELLKTKINPTESGTAYFETAMLPRGSYILKLSAGAYIEFRRLIVL